MAAPAQRKGGARRQEQEDASPEVREVAPGILRMQLPIRFTGLGHVNCYALEDERGFAIVDPGLPGKASFKALGSRLDAAGIPLRWIHTVIVTHSHPDHFGGAGLVAERAGADVVTSEWFRTWWDPDEEDVIEGRADRPDGAGDTSTADAAAVRSTRAAGTAQGARKPVSPFGRPTPWGGKTEQLSAGKRLKFRLVKAAAKRWFRTPSPTVRLEDAQTIRLARREWVALHTPGHTEDHLCLFDPGAGVLLSGDHVLPTITPHISGMISDDALARYFASLERMQTFEGVGIVLPAHGQPFSDLAGRSIEIRHHHEERLERLRQISNETGEATVQDLSRKLFAQRAWGSMAESETYAHLEHLRLAGEATRREEAGKLYYMVR